MCCGKNNYKKLKDRIKKEEKMMLNMYKCSAGKLSIGYGHNLEDKSISKRAAEVIFEDDFNDALEQTFTTDKIEDLLYSITSGNAKLLQKRLLEFVQDCMSVYDFNKKDPERSYHLFVLGLLAILKDRYDITSNRESGEGRYDIMLKPHDLDNLGIIIEI